MRWYFAFFFVSGFCSILYELVWLRMSMAQFGVTTALVSIVLSIFMAGLGIGSWGSGVLVRKYGNRIPFHPLRLYALTEFLIGASALLVPGQLAWGRKLLERTELTSSLHYYLASGAYVSVTLIPWCALMGATIPLAMLAIRVTFPKESPRSFSYLYVANVFGGVVGAGVPLLLIELLGFRRSLQVGASLNFLLAVCAMSLTWKPFPSAGGILEPSCYDALAGHPAGERRSLLLLFATGLTAMAMEVIWIRQFTPYLGTVVYAFALILAVYLASTFAGSKIYRDWSLRHDHEPQLLWSMLGLAALLPLLTVNPNLHLFPVLRLALGISPFTAMLGFATPMLIDRWSRGSPEKAGTAYAVNVIGCIVGPLLAGFVLLPRLSEPWALFVLVVPWLIFGAGQGSSNPAKEKPRRLRGRAASYLLLPVIVGLVAISPGYEEQYRDRVVLRDATATVIATGSGMRKRLLVNGVGITWLSPITKMMAHLPLAFLDRPPQNALVVCFGMGTTFRSVLSWGIPVTAVELVPSVPRLFGYYHADGPELLRSPLAHIVIDDGRRYLERTSQQYDVITIDPPPPVEAAGSSLLYSVEFYSVVRRRLRPGGILQQWLPAGDAVDVASVSRALQQSFPYVRVFPSVRKMGGTFCCQRSSSTGSDPRGNGTEDAGQGNRGHDGVGSGARR